MTVTQLIERDRRIAELEEKGRDGRTLAEQDELVLMIRRRDYQWSRVRTRIENNRRIARELEAYAQQVGLPLDIAA